MKYLLDTCTISEMISKQPNQAVLSWLDAQSKQDLCLSVITIGELVKGVHKLPDSKRKSDLQIWLDDLLVEFSGRVLLLDIDTMILWGRLIGTLQPQGRNIPLMDSLILAIALQNSLTLVTRNEKDFAGTGVTIFNPWN